MCVTRSTQFFYFEGKVSSSGPLELEYLGEKTRLTGRTWRHLTTVWNKNGIKYEKNYTNN